MAEKFDEILVKIYSCVVCDKVIELEEKSTLVHQDECGECWVHPGECYAKYHKLLHSPEAKKQGTILGICDFCAEPIREKHRYVVGRIAARKAQEDCAGKEDPFLTTFPSRLNISLAHNKCADAFYSDNKQDIWIYLKRIFYAVGEVFKKATGLQSRMAKP